MFTHLVIITTSLIILNGASEPKGEQNKKESPLEILPPQWAPDTPLSLLNWKASLFYIFHDLSPTPHCDSRAAWFSTASTTFDVVVLLVSHQEFRLEVVLGHHLELRY